MELTTYQCNRLYEEAERFVKENYEDYQKWLKEREEQNESTK